MTTRQELREAAIEIREQLGPVVLVGPDKRPLHRWKDALSEREFDSLIERAHGFGLQMWPGSAVLGLDFDGPHAWAAWEATGISLPETARTRTRSGGAHLFFRVPPGTPTSGQNGNDHDLRRKVRLVRAECDCKTTEGHPKPCGVDLLLNGYAILPPTPGYTESPDHPVELARMAVIPQAVLDLARKSQDAPERPPAADDGWFVGALRGPIPEGQRNDTATRLAGVLLAKGFGREQTLALLEPWARLTCGPAMDLGELQTTVQSVARREAAKSTAPTPLPALERPVPVLRKLRDQGDPVPTGIPMLDRQTRGGMRPGKALGIGGTAGAGKTAAGVQVAKAAVEAGCVVVCLMADEGREPAIIRLGQQYGYDRDAIEGVDHPAHETTLASLERELAGKDIFFPDPDEEADTTLEGVVEALVQAYPDRRKLVLVDSIQTVCTRQTMRDAPSVRERVMGNARIARRLAAEHGLVMVYTSEVNRSWYRSRKEEDRASDLAAFAEARIEFSADVLLTMRSLDGDPDLVEVRIPKNRLGTRQPFLLRLDRARAWLAEVDGDPRENMRDTAKVRLVEKQTEGILQALQKQPGLTQTQLCQAVGGNRTAFLEALRGVKESGIVTWKADGRSVLHHLSEVPK